MWNKLKQAANHPVWQSIKHFCGDPVQLYAVFLVMTAMYYYHEDFTWLYTLLCFPLSYVLMRFYDFVAKHRFIGPLSYIAFLVAGIYAVTLLTTYGSRDFAVSFFVWFLTPQGVTDFSLIYTIAMYLLMVGFLTSTVYYFGKIRYRMSMQFLIMLIPLSLYAKEGLQMPALLVISLLSSFFLLMIYCRQLRDSDEVRQIPNFHSGASIAVYVAAFSIIAAIIPKPEFQADREFIDNAMSYSTWSDRLMEMISSFTDVSNNRGLLNNNARTLFWVEAPETLRLHVQTRSFYAEDDSWAVTDYDRPNQPYTPPMTYQPRALLQAICDAASADAEFAVRYGLEDAVGVTLPEQQTNTFRINCVIWQGSDVLVAPTRSIDVQDPRAANAKKISVSQSHSVEVRYNTAEVKYYSDSYARFDSVRQILDDLCFEEYTGLLGEAAEIMQEDPDAAALLLQAQEEAQAAADYLAQVNELDWRPDTVVELAAQITEGLDSDLEKALAIERYFTEQGYVYDLSYEKPLEENVEDFLLPTH
ncbi:MAG: transglutaminase domain-containing protein, partial [Oscillospiraceae bacterium]|nr:transglutaminase domain-containing protein [Oscillospiraceae bacterium]